MGDSASSQLAGPSQRAGAAKDSKPSFSGNEMGTRETYATTRVHTGPASGGPDIYQGSPASVSYLSAEPANRMQFGNSSFDGQGFATKTSKDRRLEVFYSVLSGDHPAGKCIAGKTLDHGGSSMAMNANKGSSSSSLSEPNVLRASVSMDTGKSPICQSSSLGRPFNDQQLKQLRAQCLVFLAFTNGLMPKKLHLEIALGVLEIFIPKKMDLAEIWLIRKERSNLLMIKAVFHKSQGHWKDQIVVRVAHLF